MRAGKRATKSNLRNNGNEKGQQKKTATGKMGNKSQGDPMECGSYRRIKLLEDAMKVVERIFEHRIRQQNETDDMQFGFMKGKGTTDAIFYDKTDAGEF